MDEEKQSELRALRKIVDHLRQLNERVVDLSGPPEELEWAAKQLAGVRERLDQLTHAKATPRYASSFDRDDPDAVLPYSPISGAYNPVSPPVRMIVEGETMVGEATFGLHFEGPDGCVHGSVIAAAWDQMLAMANVLVEASGRTKSLTVRFLKPSPLHVPLRFEAKTEGREGRKVIARGQCTYDGVVLSEAEGEFIYVDPMQAFRQPKRDPGSR
jgi:acyl-coenzyme A thioesterase PaaI-like protein